MPISWRRTRAGFDSGPIRLKIVRFASFWRMGWMRAIAGWWFLANRKQMPISRKVYLGGASGGIHVEAERFERVGRACL